MNVMALCAGIGGGELGVEIAVPRARVICFVEGEAHAAACLVRRMEQGWLAEAPVWSNIATFYGGPWRGKADCVTAGFPCQPYSRCGRRQGEEHPHWLWPHILRITEECDPGIVFLENVDALRSQGGWKVVRDLTALGYGVAWDIFSARRVGASHSRPRLYFFAAKRDSLDDAVCGRHGPAEGEVRPGGDAAFPPNPQILLGSERVRARWPEPGLQGLSDGVAREVVFRLREGGNAQVPLVAAHAWVTLANALRVFFGGLSE